MIKLKNLFAAGAVIIGLANAVHAQVLHTDVLVIGGSASGVTAALASARLGVSTVLIEETPWLGGMVTAAGVSAFDGNHRIPSGIWNEFRERLYVYYGGPSRVSTGWVSSTLFEPHVGDSIFKSMLQAEEHAVVRLGWKFESTLKTDNRVTGANFVHVGSRERLTVHARVVIDATELGDALAHAGVTADVGLEPEVAKTEGVDVGSGKGIIQDLTYVAILKDYGASADCTIAKPRNYRAEEFDGACKEVYLDRTRKAPTVDAKTMLEYGKLPRNKYMLNWPNYGNDFYFNPILLNPAQRDSGYALAKEQTLRFVYFIQHELGFNHLGLADDEFPTADRLPFIPYHRESRRIKGIVRLDMPALAKPFDGLHALYRTAIAVGDYPIDHHHKKNPVAPQQLDFYPVPSFSIPLGTLIPQEVDGLIAAEKSISVSNLINGATRLQPCVMLIGQAAGTLAALSVQQHTSAKAVPVRDVQHHLLQHGAMLLPYIDATSGSRFFTSIQKIGATGILRGKGIPYKWANQTWFYPDQFVSIDTLNRDAKQWLIRCDDASGVLTIEGAKKLIAASASILYGVERTVDGPEMQSACRGAGLDQRKENSPITRAEFSYLLDQIIDPFSRKSVNHLGDLN